MREGADLGINQVWTHRSFGTGSVSNAATEYDREHRITVTGRGCSCLTESSADPGHKAMRITFTLTGKAPREV